MDKKEVLCIDGRFPGMKLLEIAYSDTDSIAIVNQIAEKWRGGGDYGNYENEHLVGSWCDSIASVEITKEPKDELGYEEYYPDFR